jgi:hypothetical protein
LPPPEPPRTGNGRRMSGPRDGGTGRCGQRVPGSRRIGAPRVEVSQKVGENVKRLA